MILDTLQKAKKGRTTSSAASSSPLALENVVDDPLPVAASPSAVEDVANDHSPMAEDIIEEGAAAINMDDGHKPNPEVPDGGSDSSSYDDDSQSDNTSSSYTASTPSPVDLVSWESDWHDAYACALDMARPDLTNDKRKKRIMNKVLKTIKKAKSKCESM